MQKLIQSVPVLAANARNELRQSNKFFRCRITCAAIQELWWLKLDDFFSHLRHTVYFVIYWILTPSLPLIFNCLVVHWQDINQMFLNAQDSISTARKRVSAVAVTETTLPFISNTYQLRFLSLSNFNTVKVTAIYRGEYRNRIIAFLQAHFENCVSVVRNEVQTIIY